MRIRCGRCHRVLESEPRLRTVARKDRAELDATPHSLIERMKRASELVTGRRPSHKGSVTVARGVVTAVCPCGFNKRYPLSELLDAEPSDDGDMFLT